MGGSCSAESTSVVAPEPQKQAFVELKHTPAADTPIAVPVVKLTTFNTENEDRADTPIAVPVVTLTTFEAENEDRAVQPVLDTTIKPGFIHEYLILTFSTLYV